MRSNTENKKKNNYKKKEGGQCRHIFSRFIHLMCSLYVAKIDEPMKPQADDLWSFPSSWPCLPVGCPLNTSPRSHEWGILTRCPSRLSWMISVRRGSGSECILWMFITMKSKCGSNGTLRVIDWVHSMGPSVLYLLSDPDNNKYIKTEQKDYVLLVKELYLCWGKLPIDSRKSPVFRKLIRFKWNIFIWILRACLFCFVQKGFLGHLIT